MSRYAAPNAELLRESVGTLCCCEYQGELGFEVVAAKSIQSVVAMVPFGNADSENDIRFLVEKPGLDVACMGGAEEQEQEAGEDGDVE